MTGPELKAIEGDLLAEVLLAFEGESRLPGSPHYEDDPERNWPIGMCDSTCECLHDSEEVGGYGWAEKYGLHMRSGGYFDPGQTSGHVWLQAEDGTIVDPTVGQFVDGPPLRVILPDDPLYARFTPGVVRA